RVESDLVSRLKRTHEVGNPILGEDKVTIHVIAGIEEDIYIRSCHQCAEGSRRRITGCSFGWVGRRWLAFRLNVSHSEGWGIGFSEGGDRLRYAIFGYLEVGGF